jgi:hypothetical protein
MGRFQQEETEVTEKGPRLPVNLVQFGAAGIRIGEMPRRHRPMLIFRGRPVCAPPARKRRANEIRHLYRAGGDTEQRRTKEIRKTEHPKWWTPNSGSLYRAQTRTP